MRHNVDILGMVSRYRQTMPNPSQNECRLTIACFLERSLTSAEIVALIEAWAL